MQNVSAISCKLSYLLFILPILMELSTPCNGRNIRWFLKVSNKQLNQKRFLLSDNKSQCLFFIERIVYFDKKFAVSLQTYCPDNAIVCPMGFGRVLFQ